MYLCGYTIEELIKHNVPAKLSKICEMDFSFEFSAVAMTELKDNDSACLIYATTILDRNTPRGWVEFKAPGRNTRFVRDYYVSPTDIPFLEHQHRFYPETERIYLRYIFWTRYTKELYRLAQNPETSYLLSEFFYLRPKIKDGRIYENTDFEAKNLHPTGKERNILAVAQSPETGKVTMITKDLFSSLVQ